MLPSFFLSVREGLEAALIVGILLGTLKKINRNELRPVVWRGVIGAILLSILVSYGLNRIGAELEGQAAQIFEGLTMLFAAGLLTWMILWMSRHSRAMQKNLEHDVRREAAHPGRMGLALLAFSAVLREGVELAVFLLAARFTSNPGGTLAGAVAGLLVAVSMGWVLFATTRKLPLRQFFLVTNILLILFASGLVAHGVHELNEAGWVHPLIENVWNTNGLLDEQSIPGELLKALFGYNGNPSLSEVLAYFIYFGTLLFVIRLVSTRPPARTQTAGPA